MTARVVCLAFDSPDLDLVQRGTLEGWLPSFGALVEQGRFVPLDDLQDLVTTPMWPTLVTGASVAEHLLLADEQLVPGTYRFAPAPAEASRRPPFWKHLSDRGLRSTVVGVYGAPLVPGLLGTQVVGWGTHDPFNTKESGPRADPPSILGELDRVSGHRQLRYGQWIPQSRAELEDFVALSLRSVEQQRQGLAHLLEHTQWDFFFGAFAESHPAGHLLAHLGDPGHPRHDPGVPAALQGALTSIYRAIDAAIGSLLGRLDPEVTVMIVSPYGMGPHHHLTGVIHPLLEKMGWMSRSGGAIVTQDARLRALALARRALHHLVPLGLRARLGRLVPRDRWVGALALADVDWSSTRAFALPSDGSSHVRINLRGREPGGIVDPGRDYDQLCSELTGLLLALSDPSTGETVATRVERTDRLFGVPASGPLPDLFVQWRRRHAVSAVEVPGIGILDVFSPDPRTALHWSPGFALARGAGIEPSGSRHLDGASARVVDMAATVLALMGVPQPPELSGRPIASLTRRPSSAP